MVMAVMMVMNDYGDDDDTMLDCFKPHCGIGNEPMAYVPGGLLNVLVALRTFRIASSQALPQSLHCPCKMGQRPRDSFEAKQAIAYNLFVFPMLLESENLEESIRLLQ